MKKILLLIGFLAIFGASAQNLVLNKGVIIDSIAVVDTAEESYELYLPTTFKMEETWPMLFIVDVTGNAKNTMRMFVTAAEEKGFILAASNNLKDSVSITDNMVIHAKLFNNLVQLLPIKKDRIYTAGAGPSGRLAAVTAMINKNIKGVLSIDAPILNTGFLDVAKSFHYIGISSVQNFNYPDMLVQERVLNRLKIPNQLLIYDEESVWPGSAKIEWALDYFTLASIAKGEVSRPSNFISKCFYNDLGQVSDLITEKKPVAAVHLLNQLIRVYKDFNGLDSLKATKKTIRKTKQYRLDSKRQESALFNEELIKDDYNYYLEEDIRTYNYSNLGWWKFQMEELDKILSESNPFRKQMAVRLKKYINALIKDNIDLITDDAISDEEALNLLWMVKTITDPSSFDNYLNIISYNAKQGDNSTALFYLEELLKNGYTDAETLYTLEHITFLKISPEYNEIIHKYLKDARYEVFEE